jgi:hypothetical protein
MMPPAVYNRKIRNVMLIVALVVCFMVSQVSDGRAEDDLYALNVYGGIMSSNHWDDFFQPDGHIHFEDSYLVAATLAKRIGRWEDKASYEIEGQIVKHFHLQTNWEFNALATVRWEAFWWDEFLDTSLAFGLGPSYATDEPEIEIENDGDTSRFLVYWMLELAAALPSHPNTALIVRIHHRSNAYGLVAEEGGSNALAVGLKWIF